jgi:hypothetical protein
VRIKLEPFKNDVGEVFWSAEKVDENNTPIGSYDGRGSTPEIAEENLHILHIAEQEEIAEAQLEIIAQEDLKKHIIYKEVKW